MDNESHQSRRGVLMGAGVVGLGGVLAACSTKPVPYDANQAGNQPGSTPTDTGMPSDTSQAVPASTVVKGTVLASIREIPIGGGKIFPAEKVVVTHPAAGSKIRAFSAVCTHVGCILNQISNGTINCPCHGSQFKITDGSVVAGPAPAPLPKRKVKVVKGKVVLL